MNPKSIHDKFKQEVQPILDRLTELRDDDQRELDGLVRNIPVKQAQQERHDLVRRFEIADAQARNALVEAVAESQASVASARSVVGDAQERTANLLEADQLARSGIDAQELAVRAGSALARGDLRASQVHMAASKLAQPGGKTVIGMSRLEAGIEAALDDATPIRKAALDAHRAVRLEYVEQTVERTKHRQLVSMLTGDRQGAAKASANAKLKAYDLAKAKGEPYEQEVKLDRVGADPRINKPGGA